MDTTETSAELRSELDLWLHSCDICIEIGINPVVTNCGHLFCWSCLNETFQGGQARPCPVCRADLREETEHNFPIDGSVTSAGPTVETASSDIASPTRPVPARSSLISNARMDVVQDYLDQEKDHTHDVQLALCRHVNDMRGDRIRELEQLVDNLVQMNLALLREMENQDHDRRGMSRRIAELENSTVRNVRTFVMRQRRFGRRITPTQIPAAIAESVPESAEGRVFNTN